MLLSVAVAGFALFALSCDGGDTPNNQPGPKTSLRVRLGSSKPAYLLGEPVVLKVKVTNITDSALKSDQVFVERVEPEIKVFVSSDGQSFKQYVMGIFAHPEMERNSESLDPGESREYQLCVVYTIERPSGLVFETAGTYFLKVEYPLYSWRFESGRGAFESNTIKITVRKPIPKEAEVWAAMQGKAFFYFLQSGQEMPGFRSRLLPPEVAVGLLRDFPDSTYAPALRRALAMFYEDNQYRLEPEKAGLIRVVTRIKESRLFPEDERLTVRFDPPEEKIPFGKLLELISEETGIPLDASPELRPITLDGGAARPLRQWMKLYEGIMTAIWEPRERGYVLLRTPLDEDQRLAMRRLVYFEKPIPLKEALERLSQQFPVQLQASPELGDREVQAAEITDLNRLMRRFRRELGATWVRRGEGYFLTRNPAKGRGEPADEPSEN